MYFIGINWLLIALIFIVVLLLSNNHLLDASIVCLASAGFVLGSKEALSIYYDITKLGNENIYHEDIFWLVACGNFAFPILSVLFIVRILKYKLEFDVGTILRQSVATFSIFALVLFILTNEWSIVVGILVTCFLGLSISYLAWQIMINPIKAVYFVFLMLVVTISAFVITPVFAPMKYLSFWSTFGVLIFFFLLMIKQLDLVYVLSSSILSFQLLSCIGACYGIIYLKSDDWLDEIDNIGLVELIIIQLLLHVIPLYLILISILFFQFHFTPNKKLRKIQVLCLLATFVIITLLFTIGLFDNIYKLHDIGGVNYKVVIVGTSFISCLIIHFWLQETTFYK